MIEDLADRGMLDNVLVIAMSEFGRTPRINGHIGRDHWPEAWSLVMAGCGMQARAWSSARRTTRAPSSRARSTTSATCSTPGSRPWASTRPTTEYDNDGQPLPIAHDDCRAVKELLA